MCVQGFNKKFFNSYEDAIMGKIKDGHIGQFTRTQLLLFRHNLTPMGQSLASLEKIHPVFSKQMQ